MADPSVLNSSTDDEAAVDSPNGDGLQSQDGLTLPNPLPGAPQVELKAAHGRTLPGGNYGGATVREETKIVTEVPIGSRSAVTGRAYGVNQGVGLRAVQPPNAKHVEKFIAEVLADEDKMCEHADWKIRILRAGPSCWPAGRDGVKLVCNEVIEELMFQSIEDIRATLRASHGGGKYRCMMYSGDGIRHHTWDIDIGLSTCPPIVPRSGMSGGGYSGDLSVEDADPEMRKIRIERERAKAKAEIERIDQESELRREELARKREGKMQNPEMEIVKAQIAGLNKSIEGLVASISKIAERPAVEPTSMKDMMVAMAAMFAPMVEASKSSQTEQRAIAEANAKALSDTAKINADAMVKIEESKAKLADAARLESKELMHLLIKQAAPPKEKDTLGEFQKYMGIADMLRDRIDPREPLMDPEGGIQWGALVPQIVNLLGAFASRPGQPMAAQVASAMNLPAGVTANPQQLAQFAQQLAPYLVPIAERPANALPGPQTQAALPMAPAGTLPGGNVTGTQATQINTAPDSGAASAPAAPNPSLPPNAPAGMTSGASLDVRPLDVDPTESPADRLRQRVTDVCMLMCKDCQDAVLEPSWVGDALAWNGDFLTELCNQQDNPRRVAMIRVNCDPSIWQKLEYFVMNTASPNYNVNIQTFRNGLEQLVAEYRKRRGLSAPAAPVAAPVIPTPGQ